MQPVLWRRVTEEGELVDVARMLFREYQQELGVDLCFQRFDEELAGLPGKYAPPRGTLWIGESAGEPVACGALRPLGEATGELKRFYVRPEWRRHGLATQLLEKVLADAKALSYSEVKLDSLARLAPAVAFYLRHGFEECEPYYDNTELDAVYMRLAL